MRARTLGALGLALAAGLAVGYCSGARDRDQVAAELATATTRAAALDTQLVTVRDSLRAVRARSQALDSAQRRADSTAAAHRRRADTASARRPALPDTATVVARETYELALAEIADLRDVIAWQDTALAIRDERIQVLEVGITQAIAELGAARDTLAGVRESLAAALAANDRADRCLGGLIRCPSRTTAALIGAAVGATAGYVASK